MDKNIIKTLIGEKHHEIDRALIITYDEEETIEKDGITIKVIPVWKWLLM